MTPTEIHEADYYGDGPAVSVVIPAINEENNLAHVLRDIPHWVTEVILVDGLSVDGTEAVMVSHRDDAVIVHQPVKGKGAALRAGFAAATGDIIVMIDADGSTNPREMGRFVEKLRGGADFVKGSRYLEGGGSADFSRLRSVGNKGLTVLTNLLFRVGFTDLCYGYCAFWKRDVPNLALTADGFEIESQLILSAINAGLEIAEVPSYELQRHTGVSNLNAWRDGKRVFREIMRERFNPDHHVRRDRSVIELSEAHPPSPTTEHWMPAGLERRSYRIGKRAGGKVDGYIGPDRRQPVPETRKVLKAEPDTASGASVKTGPAARPAASQTLAS